MFRGAGFWANISKGGETMSKVHPQYKPPNINSPRKNELGSQGQKANQKVKKQPRFKLIALIMNGFSNSSKSTSTSIKPKSMRERNQQMKDVINTKKVYDDYGPNHEVVNNGITEQSINDFSEALGDIRKIIKGESLQTKKELEAFFGNDLMEAAIKDTDTKTYTRAHALTVSPKSTYFEKLLLGSSTI